MLKAEAYSVIEESLTDKLVSGWNKLATPMLRSVYDALEKGDKDRAVTLVNALDLTPLVKHENFIKHVSYSSLIFGATRITEDPKDTTIADGGYKDTVAKATALFIKSVTQNLEHHVRKMLLEYVAQYDINDPTTQYGPSEYETVFKYDPGQPRDYRGRWADTLPPAPGTAPIPEGHIRLYHQTSEGALDSIERQGILLSQAQGIEGPRAIYAGPSPYYGRAEDYPTVEFHMPKEQYEAFIVRADAVPPQNIVAIHRPWHAHVRYLEEEGRIKDVMEGQFDFLNDEPVYREALEFIKRRGWGPQEAHNVVERKFTKDQPRHAAGTSEGGRWRSTGKGLHFDAGKKEWVHPDRKLSPDEQARLKAMVVPPAWTNVHLNPNPRGELQVVGVDVKGKTQYMYSGTHDRKAAAAKFARVKDFHRAQPEISKQTEKDLSDPLKRAHAAVLRMIEVTGFRVGSDADTKTRHKAFGMATLQGHHVKLDGDKITFSFTGKSGQRNTKTVTDAVLAQVIRDAKPEKGKRIFDTTDAKVRDYLHSLPGAEHFKVKDYRTWHGTGKALQVLRKSKEPTNEKEFKKLRREVGKAVAKHLGNTPAVALSSYIDPAVWHSWGAKWGVAKAELDEFRALIDEWIATTRYDVTEGDWRGMPETGLDPDDSETDELTLEVARKFDAVKPFVSFRDNLGKNFGNLAQLVSSLHTSRLAAYGYTVEAEVMGVEKYAVSEQLDNRICDICRIMHGKVFEVDDAREALDEVLNAEEPDDLKSLQPWPKQTRKGVAEFAKLTNDELVDRNWHIPPYHPACRGILVPVDKVPSIEQTASWRAAFGKPLKNVLQSGVGTDLALEEVSSIRSTLAGLKGAEAKAAWNKLKDQFDVEILEKLTDIEDAIVQAGEAIFPD